MCYVTGSFFLPTRKWRVFRKIPSSNRSFKPWIFHVKEQQMNIWDRTSYFLNRRAYYIGFGAAALFMLSYFFEVLFNLATILLLFLALVVLIESFLLYSIRKGLKGFRLVGDRMSNGDQNKVVITLQNRYHFRVDCSVIDELPYQFQERRWERKISVGADSTDEL